MHLLTIVCTYLISGGLVHVVSGQGFFKSSCGLAGLSTTCFWPMRSKHACIDECELGEVALSSTMQLNLRQLTSRKL